jgi:hypothetical protein
MQHPNTVDLMQTASDLLRLGCGIHPVSATWEIGLTERFHLCLQVCSCYFQHDNCSRIAHSGFN